MIALPQYMFRDKIEDRKKVKITDKGVGCAPLLACGRAEYSSGCGLSWGAARSAAARPSPSRTASPKIDGRLDTSDFSR
eukprot:111910-Pyramimonas_sp.AAC.1